MNFLRQLPSNSVFLLPVVALVIGLVSVNAANERQRELYDDRFQARFESDATLRLLIRNFIIETVLRDFDELVASMSARSYSGIDVLDDPATESLVASFGAQFSAQNLHLIVGSVSEQKEVFVEYAFPKTELVGREISGHPMLADLNVRSKPPFTDQIVYRASPDNDLSFTIEGALAIRRLLVSLPNSERQLIFLVKANGIEIQRATDAFLRELGPLPELLVTLVDPSSNDCMMVYLMGVGEQSCPKGVLDFSGAVVSEKFGTLAYVTPTEAYIDQFEGGRPPFAYTQLFVTLIANILAWVIAVFFWRRLSEAERELLAYQGSLKSKDQLTAALHTMVSENLGQVGSLARRVKNADGIGNEDRRYLNIALSEIGQLRLSLDAQIMTDPRVRDDQRERARDERVDTQLLCHNVRQELERIADDEGLECRLLADDDLPASLAGSQYWIESAIVALINVSQSFTDDGFIEVSVWAEISMEGEPELYVRCRDTGIGWSSDEVDDHGPINVLHSILSGLGAHFQSRALKTGAGQEHIIRFLRH